MWNLILYVLAIVTSLALYYFYDENDEKDPTKNGDCQKPATPIKAQEQRSSIGSFWSSFSSDERDELNLYERFSSLEEITAACRSAGLEECGLIFGVDFTASNEWQGKRSFGQGCLHKISGSKIYNPYQKVIWALGQTLAPLTESGRMFAYGFGDYETRDKDVFFLKKSNQICQLNLSEVLECYNQVGSTVYYGGPTSFAAIISKAIAITSESHKKYHILVIITDGRLAEESVLETEEMIVKASQFPLSIIIVGVGDGPWDTLPSLEDKNLERRKFPNIKFVDYHKTTYKVKHPDVVLVLNALFDIPNQHKQIVDLGYINRYADSCSLLSYSSILEHSSSSASVSSKASWLAKLRQKINNPLTNKNVWHQFQHLHCVKPGFNRVCYV